MKYINAKAVLPESLIRELQGYIQAGYVYIPATGEKSAGEKRADIEGNCRHAIQKYDCNTIWAVSWLLSLSSMHYRYTP